MIKNVSMRMTSNFDAADLDLDKMVMTFVSYIRNCFCNVCDYNSVPLSLW